MTTKSLRRFEIAGQAALVTGAASGLGRAFAMALAQAGARVFAVDRDVEGLNALSAIAKADSLAILPIATDVADPFEVERMSALVRSEGVGIDILVNNAGVASLPGRLHEISVADWDRIHAVNLRSVFLVSRSILPLMLQQRSGTIVNLSSFLALVGTYPGFAVTAVPYVSSKAGIAGLTRQMAVEYAADGIRVNAIAPGWHGGTNLARERRALVTKQEMEKFESFIAQSVPMGRRGTPEDLCGLLLYLASDASCYVTGQVFAHDGGLTAA
jgi:NAD(P)-dependent dehydrogenase (short-subunit alcohol dehydrogenase family)